MFFHTCTLSYMGGEPHDICKTYGESDRDMPGGGIS